MAAKKDAKDLSHAELVELAKSLGITGCSRWNKSDLAEAINKAGGHVVVRANYGPRESCRTCHACGFGGSSVQSTRKTELPGRTIVNRTRVCERCETVRRTIENVPRA